MTAIIGIVLALLGVDEAAVVDAQIVVCKMAGGRSDVREWGYMTLASCHDERGWSTPCPDAFHSGRSYHGCWVPK